LFVPIEYLQAMWKPNSVIRLGGRRSFIWAPCRQDARAPYPQLKRDGPPLAAYLGLLAVGFAVPTRSPVSRCALTAPFHPYPTSSHVGLIPGGIFSVALSRSSRRVAVSNHRALSSSDFPPGRSARKRISPAIASPTPLSILYHIRPIKAPPSPRMNNILKDECNNRRLMVQYNYCIKML